MSFIQQSILCHYTHGFVRRGPALGNGVERSVFETIFRRLGAQDFEKSHLFWNSAGAFLIPRFEPGEPASFRSKWWYTFGRLLGLYMIRCGQVPQKLSPILLLGLFSTRANEMFVTLDTLLILDKALAESLRPWYELPMGVPLPEFSREVVNLLAGQAQMDVSISITFYAVLTPNRSQRSSRVTYQRKKSTLPRLVK